MSGEATNIKNLSRKLVEIVGNRQNLLVYNIDHFLNNPTEEIYNSLRSSCYNVLSSINMPYPRIQIILPSGCVLIDTYSFELNNFSNINCINDNHLTRQDFIECLLSGQSNAAFSSNTSDFGLLYRSIRIGNSSKNPKMILRLSVFNNKDLIINERNIPGFNYIPYTDDKGKRFNNYSWKSDDETYFLNISKGQITHNLLINNSLKPYLISSSLDNMDRNINMQNTFMLEVGSFSVSPSVNSTLLSLRCYSPDNGDKLYIYRYSITLNTWEVIQVLNKNNFS